MSGRNRVVGGRRFFSGGPLGRGHAALVAIADGPVGATGAVGATGSTGATGAAGAAGTQVVTAVEAGFNPALYATGTVAFLVDSITTPTTVKYGGKKGDGGGGGFPDPIVIA